MADDKNAPIPAEEALSYGIFVAGVMLMEIGEDGEYFLINGHHDDETITAALGEYVEQVDVEPYAGCDWSSEHVWAAFRPHKADCDFVDCDCDNFGWWLDTATTTELLDRPGCQTGYYAVTIVTTL